MHISSDVFGLSFASNLHRASRTQRDREGTRSGRVNRSKEKTANKRKKQYNTFHASCVNHKKERNQPEKIEHFQYAIIRQSHRWPQPRRRSGCLLVDLHRIRFDSFHLVFSAFIPISTHINIIIVVVVQLPSLLSFSLSLCFSRIHVCTYDRFSDNKINISICKQLHQADKKDEEKNYYFDSEKNRRERNETHIQRHSLLSCIADFIRLYQRVRWV